MAAAAVGLQVHANPGCLHGSETEVALNMRAESNGMPFAASEFSASMLAYLPIEELLRQVVDLACLNRTVNAHIVLADPQSLFWQVLCEQLCFQRQLWVPAIVSNGAAMGSWRSMFKDLWPLRFRFNDGGDAIPCQTMRFRLSTFCRFRPATTKSVGAPAPSASSGSAALPLHQRVALLRQTQPNLSHKTAVQQIVAANRLQKEEPNSAAAFQLGCSASVLSINGSQGSVLTVSPGCGLRSFDFGQVFDESASQSSVYERSGLRLLTDFVNGVNGALIMFGQTGSGKTHTMFGAPGTKGDDVERGIAPRLAEAVISAISEREGLGFESTLKLSYVEIFGNEVYDLLGDSRFNNPSVTRTLFDGEFEVPISSMADLDAALELGETRKRCAETAMNERSTRAHTMIIFSLNQRRSGSLNAPVASKLFLADLGGSERVTKSKANETAKTAGYGPWSEYYDSRRRLTEANYINQGLLAFKRCIQALDQRQKGVLAGGQPVPVPFRDSRLTAVLEPALGGLARASVLVCCSPESQHAEETIQTLRFGELCSQIEHVRDGKSDPSKEMMKVIKQIDDQIEDVEGRIREKERWEWRQKVRTDVVDANDEATAKLNRDEETELGGFGAVEFVANEQRQDVEVQHAVWGQVLVGAEAEREEYEALLERRRQLLGEP